MTIDCAFYGFCAADADARTSKAGKAWVRLRVGVGKDDDVQWVNLAVFGKAAAAAATLKKADRIYVEGTIKLDSWRGHDGSERHGLSVAAFKCERAKNAPVTTPATMNATMISAFPPRLLTEHHRTTLSNAICVVCKTPAPGAGWTGGGRAIGH